jgi:hypothetical protein
MWAKAKGWVGLIVALAIPAILISVFYYSQVEADRQVAEYQVYQKAHPQIQNITVDNYELTEIGEGNIIKWKLKAKEGKLDGDTKDVNLTDVNMQCFEGNVVKMSFKAPIGLANEETHLVKLSSTKTAQVNCEGSAGAKLQAPKVELTKKNQFIATGGVTIVYPGVAKVTGSTVTGSLEHSADLKNFKIVGNTHALIGHI